MKLKEMLAKLFRKEKVYCYSTFSRPNPVTHSISPVMRQVKTIADPYGLNSVSMILESRDYERKRRSFKKVTLTNANDCKDKITVLAVQSALRGTGHVEWECLIAVDLVAAIVEALDKNSNEADISRIFSCDLLASRDRVFSQKDIYDHVIPLFEIVGETDKELRLAINIE